MYLCVCVCVRELFFAWKYFADDLVVEYTYNNMMEVYSFNAKIYSMDLKRLP